MTLALACSPASLLPHACDHAPRAQPELWILGWFGAAAGYRVGRQRPLSSQGKTGGDPRSLGTGLHGGIQRQCCSPAVPTNDHGHSKGVLRTSTFTRAWATSWSSWELYAQPRKWESIRRMGQRGIVARPPARGSECQDARTGIHTPAGSQPGAMGTWGRLIVHLFRVWSQTEAGWHGAG